MNVKQFIKNTKILHIVFRGIKKSIMYCAQLIECMRFEIYLAIVKVKLMREDSRFDKVAELKDKYKGKRCFIICTGPSLTISDLEMIKDEYSISMSSILNILEKTNFRPSMYMIQDLTSFNIFKEKFDLIPNSQIFVGISNRSNMWGKGIKIKDVKEQNVGLFHLDTASIIYQINYKVNNFRPRFSFNCRKKICDGATVTYSAIQMAVYMGFSEIFLLGADCNYLGKSMHIDDYTDTLDISERQKIDATCRHEQAYRKAADVLQKNKNCKIYNATRGGKLEVFERRTLEKILKDGGKQNGRVSN